MSAKERGFYEAGLVGHLAGTEEQVADELEGLLKETGAREVLVTTSTYDRAALVDSYRRLARVAGLTDPGRSDPDGRRAGGPAASGTGAPTP